MIEHAAVIGAGLMGTGIARHLAGQGTRVTLIDAGQEQIELARARLEGLPVQYTMDIGQAASCDFVIEAVFEDLAVKQQVMQQVCDVVDETCVIATNTSSLLVRDIGETVTHHARFLGVHYNNPADMNPVVEIIPAEGTHSSVTDRLTRFMTGSGKLAVRCADTHCFILNRQSLPYINEAVRCLDIATPGEVDHIATGKLGAGLGPFAVMNLVGLPVMAAASRNLGILGEGYLPAEALQAQYDPWVTEPVQSVNREVVTEVVRRLRGAMLFPGRDILERNLCSPQDLHNICIQALGYEKSSVELLEVLRPHIVEELIAAYLRKS